MEHFDKIDCIVHYFKNMNTQDLLLQINLQAKNKYNTVNKMKYLLSLQDLDVQDKINEAANTISDYLVEENIIFSKQKIIYKDFIISYIVIILRNWLQFFEDKKMQSKEKVIYNHRNTILDLIYQSHVLTTRTDGTIFWFDIKKAFLKNLTITVDKKNLLKDPDIENISIQEAKKEKFNVSVDYFRKIAKKHLILNTRIPEHLSKDNALTSLDEYIHKLYNLNEYSYLRLLEVEDEDTSIK